VYVRAYIGLGGNLADPVAQLRSAVAELGRLPQTQVAACSSFYRSAPVGQADQPDFINAACCLHTALAPEALLDALLAIERVHGRVRAGARGGPRTLDLDLLMYGAEVRHAAVLTLPHPRLHERAFVLAPLAEIEPDLVVPGRGPVGVLLARCAGQRVQRLAD
jgi:2-amino-4-hydroxy-6-hydroxymethyldihydropteridine diphosphokinase